MEAIVFIIIQILFVTPAVLKSWEYYPDYSEVLAGEYSVTWRVWIIARERKDLMDYNSGYETVIFWAIINF